MKILRPLRLRYGDKLFLSHLLAVFLVSGSVGTFFYYQAMDSLMRSLRSRLQNSAALLTHSLSPEEMDRITGPADTSGEAYQRNLQTLRRLRHANPDIAYLYVMRLQGERVFFVIDSDESEAQAQPGQEYTDIPPNLPAGFFAPAVDEEIYRDEWGSFLSGYAPLQGGEGRYLVGLDMRADEVDAKLLQLRLSALVSLVSSLLLALVFALYFSRGLSRRIEFLSARCRQIAAGQFDEKITLRTFDEFDDLIAATNAMSEDLGRARTQINRAMQELQGSRDDMARSVQQRTRDLERALEKLNILRGLLPICSSCKKIRDDRGYWQQVESFVEQHSEVRFTHGLCPTCAADFYAAIVADREQNPPPPADPQA